MRLSDCATLYTAAMFETFIYLIDVLPFRAEDLDAQPFVDEADIDVGVVVLAHPVLCCISLLGTHCRCSQGVRLSVGVGARISLGVSGVNYR